MPYTLRIQPAKDSRGKVWWIPPSLNARLHWRMRAEIAGVFKEQVYWLCKEAKIPKMQTIALTVRASSVRQPDLDNIAASVKPLIDGLTLAEIIPDDDPDHLVSLTIKSLRVGTFAEQTLVLIIEKV